MSRAESARRCFGSRASRARAQVVRKWAAGPVRLDIRKEPVLELGRLAGIASAFRVERTLDVVAFLGRAADFSLREREVSTPWIKDYDAIVGNHPSDWPRQFDLSNWGLLSARIGERWIGAAVLAWKTAGVRMLEGRDDLALLWDIRVGPDSRRLGVGSRLFSAALAWSRARGCRELKIETQNVNVGACRFYAKQGCRLHAIDRRAYPDLPDEVQLIWSISCGPAP